MQHQSFSNVPRTIGGFPASSFARNSSAAGPVSAASASVGRTGAAQDPRIPVRFNANPIAATVASRSIKAPSKPVDLGAADPKNIIFYGGAVGRMESVDTDTVSFGSSMAPPPGCSKERDSHIRNHSWLAGLKVHKTMSVKKRITAALNLAMGNGNASVIAKYLRDSATARKVVEGYEEDTRDRLTCALEPLFCKKTWANLEKKEDARKEGLGYLLELDDDEENSYIIDEIDNLREWIEKLKEEMEEEADGQVTSPAAPPVPAPAGPSAPADEERHDDDEEDEERHDDEEDQERHDDDEERDEEEEGESLSMEFGELPPATAAKTNQAEPCTAKSARNAKLARRSTPSPECGGVKKPKPVARPQRERKAPEVFNAGGAASRWKGSEPSSSQGKRKAPEPSSSPAKTTSQPSSPAKRSKSAFAQ